MFDDFAKLIKRIFGIVAGSLSAIGVFLTAIGFLVENSYQRALGFTDIPIDLNQYLFTGGLFVLLLVRLVFYGPFLVVLHLLESLQGAILIALVLLPLIISKILKRRGVKFPEKWKFFGNLKTAKGLKRLTVTILIAQAVLIVWMVGVSSAKNLLFDSTVPAVRTNLISALTDMDVLNSLARAKYVESPVYEQVGEILGDFYVLILWLVIFSGLVLFRIWQACQNENKDKKLEISLGFYIALSLLVVQVYFIPVLYGTLLHSKNYHKVRVYTSDQPQVDTVPEVNIVRSSEPSVGQLRNQMLSPSRTYSIRLSGTPALFPSIENPNYMVESDNYNLVVPSIENNERLIIQTSKKSLGEALITVSTADSTGTLEQVQFAVTVVGTTLGGPPRISNNNRPSEELHFMPGDPPWRINLNKSAWFYSSDSLSYRAYSDSPEKVGVSIQDGNLSLEPRSEGHAVITVVANKGTGADSEIKLVANVWSKDDRLPPPEFLLELYHDDDIYYFYSKYAERIWRIEKENIDAIVIYGLEKVR